MRADEGLDRAHRFVRATGAADLLYGAVVSSSILAVSSAKGGTGSGVLLATSLVSVVFWLAHVYVDAVGARFDDREHSTGFLLAHALRTNLGVLLGALPPLGAFIVARAFGAGVSTAAFAALWFAVALLTCVAALAAHRAGARGWALVGETAVAGALGLVVIALKTLLH